MRNFIDKLRSRDRNKRRKISKIHQAMEGESKDMFTEAKAEEEFEVKMVKYIRNYGAFKEYPAIRYLIAHKGI